MYCNTMNGNKDVYIGNSKMLEDLKGEYCGHSKNLTESYTRTYRVISSSINQEDQEFNIVTLEQNSGLRGSVSIHNSYSLIPGKTYEFSFLTFDTFDDTIENIFYHSILLKTIQTDKSSPDQINERIIVNKDFSNGAELNELDHVRMDIIEGTLTKTSARISITDFSNNKYLYGEDYRIDKNENGKWITLEERNLNLIHDIAYFPDQSGHIELDIDWNYVYGKLSPGKYRIVKTALLNSDRPCESECQHYYFSVEFYIE